MAAIDADIDRIGRLRLGVFFLSVGLFVFALVTSMVSPWWAVVGIVPFLVLVFRTKVLAYRRVKQVRAVWYYKAGLNRLAGKWVGQGSTGERFAKPDDLFAADLDLFGNGSLFQRLNTARTVEGEQHLAAWLLNPATANEVQSRQHAVADLRNRLDLREYFATLVVDGTEAADFATLAAWGQEPLREVAAWRRWGVVVLGWSNVAGLFGWLFLGTTGLPLVVTGALSYFTVWPLLAWAKKVNAPIDATASELPLLEAILTRLEAETFDCPRLQELQTPLTLATARPSQQLRDLRTLADWYSSRLNPLFLPIALLLLWDVQFALRFEAWRARSGPLIAKWLHAIAELEALSSLAAYAFENPADPFPNVLETPEPQFDGHAIGHPLLAHDKSVRNDVRFGGATRLLMISGSNMSGKSTILRSVGVNIVLALAGAPVRATSLTLSPMAIGATMRVQDSLQDGKSRFFAEVTRVRTVLDRANGPKPPVLFLFDELFAGTNSADRLIGAEAVLRKLLDLGAVGLVTTHDLALTEAADRLGNRVVNVHFADQLTHGEMSFDYTMRPGIVPHGNGIALMRAVGLDV